MKEFINPYSVAFENINIKDWFHKIFPSIKKKREEFGVLTQIVNPETLEQFFIENKSTPLEKKIQIIASRLFKSVSQIGHEREKLFECLQYTKDVKQLDKNNIHRLAERLLKIDTISIDNKKSFMIDSLRQYITVSSPKEVFDRLIILKNNIPDLYMNVNPYVSQKLLEYIINRFRSTLGKNNDLLKTIENNIQNKNLEDAISIMKSYLKED